MLTEPHSEGGVILSPKDGRCVTHSTEETAAGGQVLFLHLPSCLSLPPPPLVFPPSTISLSGDATENTAMFLSRDVRVLHPPAALMSD